MGTTLHFPSPPLSQYIDCFWSQIGVTPYLREKIVPNGTIELMINFGAAHKVVGKYDHTKFNLHKESWVAGLQTEFIVTEAVAETNMVGVRFKPGGAYPFFDCPIAELSDQVTDMELIWGSFVGEIRERLFEVSEPIAKLRLLEELLLQRLKPDLYGLDAIQFAMGDIQRLDGFTTVRNLSDRIGMSQKHLINQFNKMVGAKPKIVHRIAKFNHALNAIDPQKPPKWVEIAHQCNYYDQAHFIRDFAKFTGLRPTDYLRLRNHFFGDTLGKGDAVQFIPVE